MQSQVRGRCAPPAPADRPKRVLVVDDDADVRLWLRTTLEFNGWEVSDAGTAGDGVARARREPFDVVILDQMMPAMTGLEAAAELRPGYDKPLVLFSAYLSPELERRAEELGVTPVSKLDQGGLLRVLDRLDGSTPPAQ